MQGRERLVNVGDQRVLLAAVGHEVVALELHGVVLADLLLDVAALQAGVGRQELAPVARGGHVVADVAGHGELRVQVEYLRAGLAALAHVEAGCGLHVGKQVGALVGGDVLVDVAELLLDDAEALVDEHGGAHGDLVLVLDPVLVVDGDQGVEHVLGALGVDVLEREVDDRGVLAVEGGREARGVGGRGPGDGGARDVDGQPRGGPVAAGGLDEHPACRGRDGDAGRGGEAFRGVLLLAVAGEAGEPPLPAALGVHHHRGGLVVLQVEEGHLHGQLAPVEHAAVEVALGGVVHVEVQPLDHVEHDGGRLHGDELVVDVRVGLEDVDVAQHAGGVGDGLPLGVGLDQDGGRAGVDGRRGEQVGGRRAEAGGQREGEPLPVGQAEAQELLKAHEVVGRAGLGGGVGVILR